MYKISGRQRKKSVLRFAGKEILICAFGKSLLSMATVKTIYVVTFCCAKFTLWIEPEVSSLTTNLELKIETRDEKDIVSFCRNFLTDTEVHFGLHANSPFSKQIAKFHGMLPPAILKNYFWERISQLKCFGCSAKNLTEQTMSQQVLIASPFE